MNVEESTARRVIGVDTHKDLHVAAVVDEHDRILGTQCFATTRQGYRQMLAWMRSFGDLQRIGVESSGSYGAGLLRFAQKAGIEVVEVTTPDKQDRRRRARTTISMRKTPHMRHLSNRFQVRPPFRIQSQPPQAGSEWAYPCSA